MSERDQMSEDQPVTLSPEALARRRRRSIAIGVTLAALAVIFYLTTFVRLAQQVPG